MDSKVVNTQIKCRIWPLLRESGFATFSSRTAWRHHENRIDVLNFQSFNSYNADVIGCTTYSFSVNLGCFLSAIPPKYEPSRMKNKDGKLVPQEYECQFRGRLTRSFEQPELRQKSIWYIDPDEKYLGWAFTDIESLVASKAIPWFNRFENPEYPIQVLLNEDEDMDKLWGFGRNPCPARHYMTGYLALSAGHLPLANFHLSKVLASSSFKSIKERLSRDLQRTNDSFESDELKTRP